jgi:hypothetical protein
MLRYYFNTPIGHQAISCLDLVLSLMFLSCKSAYNLTSDRKPLKTEKPPLCTLADFL